MSEDHASPIPGKLRGEGFAVLIERMNGGRGNRLWCTTATRDGMTWTALGEDLGTVLLELHRQTKETDGDWREMIADEMLETARGLLGTTSPPAKKL